MSAVEIRVWINHFRLKPNSKTHALFIHLGYQWCKAVWVFSWINIPIPKRLCVIIAGAKPTIVQNKPLGPNVSGVFDNLCQSVWRMIEIDRLPTIIVNGAGQ